MQIIYNKIGIVLSINIKIQIIITQYYQQDKYKIQSLQQNNKKGRENQEIIQNRMYIKTYSQDPQSSPQLLHRQQKKYQNMANSTPEGKNLHRIMLRKYSGRNQKFYERARKQSLGQERDLHKINHSDQQKHNNINQLPKQQTQPEPNKQQPNEQHHSLKEQQTSTVQKQQQKQKDKQEQKSLHKNRHFHYRKHSIQKQTPSQVEIPPHFYQSTYFGVCLKNNRIRQIKSKHKQKNKQKLKQKVKQQLIQQITKNAYKISQKSQKDAHGYSAFNQTHKSLPTSHLNIRLSSNRKNQPNFSVSGRPVTREARIPLHISPQMIDYSQLAAQTSVLDFSKINRIVSTRAWGGEQDQGLTGQLGQNSRKQLKKSPQAGFPFQRSPQNTLKTPQGKRRPRICNRTQTKQGQVQTQLQNMNTFINNEQYTHTYGNDGRIQGQFNKYDNIGQAINHSRYFGGMRRKNSQYGRGRRGDGVLNVEGDLQYQTGQQPQILIDYRRSMSSGRKRSNKFINIKGDPNPTAIINSNSPLLRTGRNRSSLYQQSRNNNSNKKQDIIMKAFQNINPWAVSKLEEQEQIIF